MQEILFAFGADQGKKKKVNIFSAGVSAQEFSFSLSFCQAPVATHREYTLIYSFSLVVSGGDDIQS